MQRLIVAADNTNAQKSYSLSQILQIQALRRCPKIVACHGVLIWGSNGVRHACLALTFECIGKLVPDTCAGIQMRQQHLLKR